MNDELEVTTKQWMEPVGHPHTSVPIVLITECLDWILISNRRHLERVLTAYLAHYNTGRPHRGINLDVPVPVPVLTPYTAAARTDPAGHIQRVDVLGGLIHEYRHAA